MCRPGAACVAALGAEADVAAVSAHILWRQPASRIATLSAAASGGALARISGAAAEAGGENQAAAAGAMLLAHGH